MMTYCSISVYCLQTVPLFRESEERLIAKLAEQADKGEATDIVECVQEFVTNTHMLMYNSGHVIDLL